MCFQSLSICQWFTPTFVRIHGKVIALYGHSWRISSLSLCLTRCCVWLLAVNHWFMSEPPRITRIGFMLLLIQAGRMGKYWEMSCVYSAQLSVDVKECINLSDVCDYYSAQKSFDYSKLNKITFHGEVSSEALWSHNYKKVKIKTKKAFFCSTFKNAKVQSFSLAHIVFL